MNGHAGFWSRTLEGASLRPAGHKEASVQSRCAAEEPKKGKVGNWDEDVSSGQRQGG